MQVGTPPQTLRLLPSTSGNAIWPVLSEGCISSDPSNCADLRGSVFFPNESSTWSEIGLYQLPLTEESALGYSGNGSFGFDNVILSRPGDGLPSLSHQVIEGIATKDFYIGSLGLAPYAVNISNITDPHPSFLGALSNESKISSTSWAYTAGANYRQPTAFGSLTLGGYDAARFVQNNISFPFGPDISRDLLVGIQSISSDATSSPLLPTGIYAFLDSLVPHIWLPVEACQAFEKAFGLTYNGTAGLYLVDDALHSKLLAQNPNVTFKLGGALAGGDSVDIVMQYGSFDLVHSGDQTINNNTRYFPLRQAHNTSQYTLGRAFFQDAYVIADYDRSNFSVSQAIFPNASHSQSIVAIHPPGYVLPSTQKASLSVGAIVGIVASVVGVIAILIVGYTIYRRRMQRREKAKISKSEDKFEGWGYNKAELSANEKVEMSAKTERKHDAVELTSPEKPYHAELLSPQEQHPELPTGSDVKNPLELADPSTTLVHELPAPLAELETPNPPTSTSVSTPITPSRKHSSRHDGER